jgi:hypothetical protein
MIIILVLRTKKTSYVGKNCIRANDTFFYYANNIIKVCSS